MIFLRTVFDVVDIYLDLIRMKKDQLYFYDYASECKCKNFVI